MRVWTFVPAFPTEEDRQIAATANHRRAEALRKKNASFNFYYVITDPPRRRPRGPDHRRRRPPSQFQVRERNLLFQ